MNDSSQTACHNLSTSHGSRVQGKDGHQSLTSQPTVVVAWTLAKCSDGSGDDDDDGDGVAAICQAADRKIVAQRSCCQRSVAVAVVVALIAVA